VTFVFQPCKWIPQGWQWVDPEKEFKAIQLAIRSGLMSRSEAISSFGYDAEDVDREIAVDNARADQLGLVLDTDPRRVAKTGVVQAGETLPTEAPQQQ
jgi:capsid protein